MVSGLSEEILHLNVDWRWIEAQQTLAKRLCINLAARALELKHDRAVRIDDQIVGDRRYAQMVIKLDRGIPYRG